VAVGGIDGGDEAGREADRHHLVDEGMQATDDRGGPGLGQRVRAYRAAELAHRAGGGEAVPGGVADDEHETAVGQPDRVVPVAADRILRGGQVPRGQREPGDLGQRPGQQAGCSTSAASAASRARR
jgi:hypothetical protein